MAKRKLILVQDGAIDELASVLLLAAMPHIDIQAIEIINADCLALPTYQATVRLLKLIGRDQIPVTISPVRGWNPFPWEYRQYAMMVNLLPLVNQYTADVPVPPPASYVGLSDILAGIHAKDKSAKVTVLCLGPLTSLAEALGNLPYAKSMIEEVVWMGGVYTPPKQSTYPGNIDTGIAPGANPNAEWNAYWDPYAVDTVWKSGVPFTMFPLNVTNSVVLTPEIIRKYFLSESGQWPILDLMAQMYALVAFQNGFSFWDTATTAYLGDPGIYGFTDYKMAIDTCMDPGQQGTIRIAPKKGCPIRTASAIKVDAFYDYLVAALKTLPVKT
jgi:purine nucleosidase